MITTLTATVERAAELVGLPRNYVYRLLASGRINAVDHNPLQVLVADVAHAGHSRLISASPRGVVCGCWEPDPDRAGQCRDCHRLVVIDCSCGKPAGYPGHIACRLPTCCPGCDTPRLVCLGLRRQQRKCCPDCHHEP